MDKFLPIQVNSFSEVFSLSTTLSGLITAVVNAFLMGVIAIKYLRALQQCGYKSKEYRNWLFSKDNSSINSLAMLTLLSLLGYFLIGSALSFIDSPIVVYSGFIIYGIFLAVYFRALLKRKAVGITAICADIKTLSTRRFV